MTYFDEHPKIVRLLIVILTIYLCSLAGITFYRFTSTPTDENLFTDPPSSLYIVKSFPIAGGEKRPHKAFESMTPVPSDSIRVGDLLIEVNGQRRFWSSGEVDSLIRSAPRDSTVRLVVERCTENAAITVKVRKEAIPMNFVRTIPFTAYVVDVTEGGASDRAGMKVGDLILRINGKEFGDKFQADAIMRQGQIGKGIAYEVLRADRTLMLNVTLASFGIPISLLVIFISGCVYLATGIFLSLKRPGLKAARLTGLAFLLLGFFIVVTFIQRDMVVDAFVRLRGFTLACALFGGFALAFHSKHYFPKERPELLSRRWISITMYVLAIVNVVLTNVLKGNAGLIGLCIMMLYAFGVAIYFRKGASPEYKKLSRIINGATLFSSLLTVGFVVVASISNYQVNFVYMGVALVAMPLAHIYSIGRYRLLDLDLRVRRNIQYSVISWLWTLLLITGSIELLITLPQTKLNLPNVRLTGASIEILNTPTLPGQQEPFEKAVLMAGAVVLTFTIAFVGRKGQGVIDRLYDRARYDYRRAANELAEVMGTRLGMVDLARGVVEKLSELMKLKRVGVLFFRDEKTCCCSETHGFDGTGWKSYCLASDKELIEAIQKFKGEFSVDYLPMQIKEHLRRQEFHYIIPIRSKEKLIGALFVGEKLSETTFNQEDLALLSSTSKQASVAIENAFLYEELAEQERIKHELDIARRIQEGLFPKSTPSMKGLDIAGLSIPAMSVGGDYFDYIQLGPKKLLVVVADVSGKGMSAALYMSKIQGMVQLAAHMYKTPKEMLVNINRRIFEGMERKVFITMILAVFDLQKKEVRICRAGHNKALIGTNGKLQYLSAHGIGLGLERGKIFEKELQEIRKPLTKDGIFVFYSDGLTEAMDAQKNQFGEETVHTIVQSGRRLQAKELQRTILSSVDKFRGNAEPHDDLTLVVVKTAG